MKVRHWLWLMVALPLLCLPRVMREGRSQEAAAPVKEAAPGNADITATPAAPAPEADAAEPPAADEADDQEQVSADNNLSFPVDI